jgi:quinolinate synthase
MIHPTYLLDVLQRIEAGEEANRIVVPEETAVSARNALSRMLSIPS